MAKVSWSNKEAWDDVINKVLLFYRALKGRNGERPFGLIFRQPCHAPTPLCWIQETSDERGRKQQISRVYIARKGREDGSGSSDTGEKLQTGGELFLWKLRTPTSLKWWWMDQFTVTEARHARYHLRRGDGKRSRAMIHTSGLQPYLSPE